VVDDGTKGEVFEQVGAPVISPDGKKVAYWAKKDEKVFVVCANRKSAEYVADENPIESQPNSGRLPHFSADAKKLAYGVRIGRELRWKVMKVE